MKTKTLIIKIIKVIDKNVSFIYNKKGVPILSQTYWQGAMTEEMFCDLTLKPRKQKKAMMKTYVDGTEGSFPYKKQMNDINCHF